MDETAHVHGTLGPEHREAAERAGSLVARVAATLDPEQDTLLVLSDHGHVPRGGHGGDEPETHAAFLLASGGLARRGVELGERPAHDVASTLAVLAGLPSPGGNLGTPMLDMLSLDDRVAARLLAGPFDQAAHLLCRLSPSPRCAAIDAIVERLSRADASAAAEAETLAREIEAARDRALAGDARSAALRRLSLTLLLIALAAGALAVHKRRAPGPPLDLPALALPLVNAGVYAAVLGLAFGYRPSFSTMHAGPRFGLDAAPAALAAVVALALAAALLRPGRLAPWVLLAGTAIPFAVLAAWVGADPAVLPSPTAGILVFLLAPAVVSAAAGAVLLAALGPAPRAALAPAKSSPAARRG
ncbi:MAG: hypothetical protein U0359_11415 [Byssovorax sp.]